MHEVILLTIEAVASPSGSPHLPLRLIQQPRSKP